MIMKRRRILGATAATSAALAISWRGDILRLTSPNYIPKRGITTVGWNPVTGYLSTINLNGGEVSVWDEKLREVSCFTGQFGFEAKLIFANEGQALLLPSNKLQGNVYGPFDVYNITTGIPERIVPPVYPDASARTNRFRSITSTKTLIATLHSFGAYFEVCLFSQQDYGLIRKISLTKEDGQVQTITLSPDSTLLFAGMADGSIKYANTADYDNRWKNILSKKRSRAIVDLDVHPNGSIVAFSFSEIFKREDTSEPIEELESLGILDLTKSFSHKILLSSRSEVVSVAWRPDGDYLAALSIDGTIHCWSDADLQKGQAKTYASLRPDTKISYNKESSSLAVCGDGKVQLFKL